MMENHKREKRGQSKKSEETSLPEQTIEEIIIKMVELQNRAQLKCSFRTPFGKEKKEIQKLQAQLEALLESYNPDSSVDASANSGPQTATESEAADALLKAAHSTRMTEADSSIETTETSANDREQLKEGDGNSVTDDSWEKVEEDDSAADSGQNNQVMLEGSSLMGPNGWVNVAEILGQIEQQMDSSATAHQALSPSSLHEHHFLASEANETVAASGVSTGWLFL